MRNALLSTGTTLLCCAALPAAASLYLLAAHAFFGPCFPGLLPAAATLFFGLPGLLCIGLAYLCQTVSAHRLRKPLGFPIEATGAPTPPSPFSSGEGP